jgi:hypothetical protein
MIDIRKSLSRYTVSHSRNTSICSSENRSNISSARASALDAYFSTRLLHRLVGPFDGRSRPGPKEAETHSGRGASNTRAATVWRAMIAAGHRFEDSLIADLIGAVALFGLLIGGLFLGYGMGLQ